VVCIIFFFVRLFFDGGNFLLWRLGIMSSGFDLRIPLSGIIVMGLLAGLLWLFPSLGNFINSHFTGGEMLIGIVVLWVIGYVVMILLCNYFIEYRDEYYLRCRIFGHSDKNMGKRTKILYPDTQPNDLWEYELYKCRWCGKENEGWYHHNITSQERYDRQNWKIKLF
jgi:hypothetical protein